ncbi:MAG: hypothetical protein LBK56_08305 [Gracilibacteraceae bacterium]|jgi:predicted transcriptional regulator|nr:hypothetical protein [Gracilibacteraceae bacterium]
MDKNYIPEYLKDHIIYENESFLTAIYKLEKNRRTILACLNENGKYSGIITPFDYNCTLFYDDIPNLTAGDICNKNSKFIRNKGDMYNEARNAFARFGKIRHSPVLDENNFIIDIISREQAFYHKF